MCADVGVTRAGTCLVRESQDGQIDGSNDARTRLRGRPDASAHHERGALAAELLARRGAPRGGLDCEFGEVGEGRDGAENVVLMRVGVAQHEGREPDEVGDRIMPIGQERIACTPPAEVGLDHAPVDEHQPRPPPLGLDVARGGVGDRGANVRSARAGAEAIVGPTVDAFVLAKFDASGAVQYVFVAKLKP